MIRRFVRLCVMHVLVLMGMARWQDVPPRVSRREAERLMREMGYR